MTHSKRPRLRVLLQRSFDKVLEASLREHSKLRCKSKVSVRAYSKFHCDHTRSFAATILEARSFEYDRSESSSTLDYTRSETSFGVKTCRCNSSGTGRAAHMCACNVDSTDMLAYVCMGCLMHNICAPHICMCMGCMGCLMYNICAPHICMCMGCICASCII